MDLWKAHTTLDVTWRKLDTKRYRNRKWNPQDRKWNFRNPTWNPQCSKKQGHAARNDSWWFLCFFLPPSCCLITFPGFCVQNIFCRLAFRMVFAWLRNRFEDFKLVDFFFFGSHMFKDWMFVVLRLQVLANLPSCFNWASFGTLHLQTKLYI